MPRLLVLFSLAVLSSFAGCFCVPQQMSCDYRGSGQNGCADLYENKDYQLGNTLQTICELQGGSFTTPGLCSRTGALGGCLCEGCERGRSVTWIWAPGPDGGIPNVAALQAECMRQSRTFVDTNFTP
jgi:hypothetical protein